METVSEHIASKGGVISTKDLEGRAEYERLRRAVSKGDIVRLRHLFSALGHPTFSFSSGM